MAATKWITGIIVNYNPTYRGYLVSPHLYNDHKGSTLYINYQETVWGFKVLARPPTLAQHNGGGIFWKIPLGKDPILLTETENSFMEAKIRPAFWEVIKTTHTVTHHLRIHDWFLRNSF